MFYYELQRGLFDSLKYSLKGNQKDSIIMLFEEKETLNKGWGGNAHA